MNSLYIEDNASNNASALSWNIAYHLYARHIYGKAVIVTDTPVALLAAVKKQWNKLIRQVQKERAATLEATKIAELTNQITSMQRLTFSATATSDVYTADVTFQSPDALQQIPPVCPTMYIATSLSTETAYLITSWLPRHAVVIIYAKLTACE